MIMEKAAEEEDVQIKDLARFSLIHNFNSFRLLFDMEYILLNGGFPPSTREIAWST